MTRKATLEWFRMRLSPDLAEQGWAAWNIEYRRVGSGDGGGGGVPMTLDDVTAAIARLEMLQPVLNGLACADFDRARERARAAKPGDHYFTGVPTLVKDNSDVEGLPTQ